MTSDNIIRLAQEAVDKDKVNPWDGVYWTFTQKELERFADLIAEATIRAREEK